VSVAIRIEQLTETNFADFERLTACGKDGGCYCAFWHQKWPSMTAWQERQRDAPELNKQSMLDRVRSGFHVGVLAYRGDELVAWVSIAPLPEVYWAWRRTAQVGEEAKDVAGITCITAAPEHRGSGLLAPLLVALQDYGRARGWSAIEGFPFDPAAIEQHGDALSWAGHAKAFLAAGFERVAPHWLSKPEAERSVYRVALVRSP
jgi:hypothetical protein